jgi:hypothetical protein
MGMKHARSDYDTIQDSSDRIPEHEPVFLLRATDKIAPDVVRVWIMMARQAGANVDILQLAHDQANKMEEYGRNYGCHTPDLPPRHRAEGGRG